ncbi:MAG: hypothetical protein GXP26_06160 [Planctomycetes bacterium]|nr:hypothetical protein [Planctomycetota bacterium]
MRNDEYGLTNLAGCHCWLAQQCEADTRFPLLDKPGSATQETTLGQIFQLKLGHYFWENSD